MLDSARSDRGQHPRSREERPRRELEREQDERMFQVLSIPAVLIITE